MRLTDGTQLLIRPVLPEDKPRFQEGLQRLSPASRHYRFLVGLARFTEQQLAELIDVDRRTHAAWVAADPRDPGLRGVGVGRFVLSPDDSTEAELALTVADEFQSRGVGRLMLALLVLSASGRGVRRFTGRVAFDNFRAAAWFTRLGGTLEAGEDAYRLHLPIDRDRQVRQLLPRPPGRWLRLLRRLRGEFD